MYQGAAMRLLKRLSGLLIVGLLAACSSTMPQSATNPRSGGATRSATTVPASTRTATPEPTARATDGPVTPSMASLQLDGERYAALGDPAAPITIVEYSDYG